MQRIIFFSFLFLNWAFWAQELAPVQNFGTNEYQAGNQNWMISQGNEGNIFIANSAGLLEFSGAHWYHYPVPNKTHVRAVKVVGEKIFTGAYMEVGYWQKNRLGSLEYNSLLPSFPGPLNDGEQFWHIENLGHIVVMQSFDGIYLLDLDTGKISNLQIPDTPISNLYKAGDDLYFLVPQLGLYQISGESSKLVIPAEMLDGSEIVLLEKREGGLEIVTKGGNFYSWKNGQLEKILQGLTENLKGMSIFSALALEDETFLLGSVENGLFQMDRSGKILQHFNQEKGLQNNTVLSLFIDAQQNVWAGLDNGLSVVNINSPFRLYHDNVGKIGTVYTSFQDSDYLYLGTNQGLYYQRKGEEKFNFIEGTNGQVWSLQKIGDWLFCGHNDGTFLIEGVNASKVSNRLGTWTLKEFKDDLFVQGHYNGLSFLKREAGGFRELPMLKDFPHSSKHIVTTEDGLIWVGNEHKGVFRIKPDSSFQKIEEIKNYPLDKSLGITSSIFQFQDKLYYSTRNRIYYFDQVNDTFSEGGELGKALEGIGKISGRMVTEPGKIWGFSENYIFSLAPSPVGKGYSIKKVFIPHELRNIPQGYENISHLGSDRYLLGLVDGYLLFKKNFKPQKKNHELRIENVWHWNLEEEPVLIPLELEEKLHYQNNNLKLQFSIAEFEKFSLPQFSYRLKGLSNRWSPWSSATSATFENLPFGQYEFEVRGKVGNELVPAVVFPFKIARPWYFSNWAILVYFLLFLSLLFLVHQVYKREHRKRIREHEKSLKMKNLEAQQEIIKLQNDQLEKEMESKNKELAISTMSLIKKNEFLNNIKDKLKDAESAPGVKTVIGTIDKDISEEDNWKFFKKAFENADKDFFKKIKAKHPGLTSNDLKLCAYLRLNLSSKEIAPLLNISVKSVEIKRYRLRKKMDLPHESSLTDYILEI